MTCSQVRDLAGAYALNALPRHDRHQVEQHLSRCPRCRRQLAELGDAVATFARRAIAPVSPPARVKERLLQAVQAEARSGAAPAPAGHPRAGRPTLSLAQARGRLAPRLVRALPHAAAAMLLFALGWAAARLPLPFPAPGAPAAGWQLELATRRLEQELWQSLAPPAAAVVRLQTHPRLGRQAVAFAAVAGEGNSFRLKVVARGLPSDTVPLGVWVVLRDGSMQPVGALVPSGADRWELETVVNVAPDRLASLQVRTATDATAEAGQLMWARLWPSGTDQPEDLGAEAPGAGAPDPGAPDPRAPGAGAPDAGAAGAEPPAPAAPGTGAGASPPGGVVP